MKLDTVIEKLTATTVALDSILTRLDDSFEVNGSVSITGSVTVAPGLIPLDVVIIA